MKSIETTRRLLYRVQDDAIAYWRAGYYRVVQLYDGSYVVYASDVRDPWNYGEPFPTLEAAIEGMRSEGEDEDFVPFDEWISVPIIETIGPDDPPLVD